MTSPDQAAFLARQFATQLLGNYSGSRVGVMQSVISELVQRTLEGHSSVRLDDIAATVGLADVRQLRHELLETGFVSSRDTQRPLVIDDDNRLYLARYLQYEREVATALLRRGTEIITPHDPQAMKRQLDRLFPRDDEGDQKIAVAVAGLRRFSVITGGPGTGKTTTVVRLLLLLAELEPGLRIALAAPTGKAARRVSDALRDARAQLSGRLLETVPEAAVTLHRLLGQHRASTRCTYNQHNALPFDVVVVDEASMIDIAMMSRLLRALPEHSRLVLLGDKDQLASVEPGIVLSDICADTEGFSPRFASLLARCGAPVATAKARSRLQDCVAYLNYSYRFDAHGGIGRLADAIRRGDTDQAIAAVRSEPATQLVEPSAADSGNLASEIVRGYEAYFTAVASGADPARQLQLFDRFRLLCCFRHGRTGVAGLNEMSEQVLARAGHIPTRAPQLYPGRPLLVTSNDYSAQLFNGDIGITVVCEDQQRIAFAADDGVRLLSFSRVPEHETVYAMTVHKCQGSEFDAIVLVLPDQVVPLTSRELIYTAVTRAREQVIIFGSEPVLRAALDRPQSRSSGLAARLMDKNAPSQHEMQF